MPEPRKPRKQTPRKPIDDTIDISLVPEVGTHPPKVPLGMVPPVDIDLDTVLVGKNPPKSYRLRAPQADE